MYALQISSHIILRSNWTATRRMHSTLVRKLRRLQLLKENAEQCVEVLKSSNSKFVLFYDSKPLMTKSGSDLVVALKSLQDLQEKFQSCDEILKTSVLLYNYDNNKNEEVFAVEIPPGTEVKDDLGEMLSGKFVTPRKALMLVSDRDIGMLSQAISYLHWHGNNQFCSKCGSRSIKTPSGSHRHCSDCKTTHYPMTSPVVITLVHHGDHCLLARQPEFQKNFYSALAGFCDIGETFEAAVEREVAEEVGLEVDNIRFFSSQHWPFPASSLMLGCHARLKEGTEQKIALDKAELEDALWFHRDEVKKAVLFQPKHFTKTRTDKMPWFSIPPPLAIAHHLIKSWALN
ncbi:NAD(P)H pyrophosphatase NUDT13, mitochondrial-like [Ptychodera flava]|uniref:NAD(P)H pyrophosphatase NUDT13, mitochondrial-like n=1 Tax=Ptychodera flava TaxID=63121 RepID=UPI00396A6883